MKTKTINGKDVPMSEFAYVGDPENLDTWHLPIHDADHVRAAMARVDQTDGIPTHERMAVIHKILSAAKMFGVDTYGFRQSHNLSSADDSSIGVQHCVILAEADATITDPTKKGWVWNVEVVAAGLASHYVTMEDGTKLQALYTPTAVSGSVKLFDKAQVYAHASGPHVTPENKSSRDLVGMLSKPQTDGKKITAALTILPSGAWLRDNLLAGFAADNKALYELSIDALGMTLPVKHENKTVAQIDEIARVNSVDVVHHGAAGGRFTSLAASTTIHPQHSQGATPMNVKFILTALFAMFYPAYAVEKNIDWAKVNENELYTHLLAADKPQSRLKLPDGFDAATIQAKFEEVRAGKIVPIAATDAVQLKRRGSQQLRQHSDRRTPQPPKRRVWPQRLVAGQRNSRRCRRRFVNSARCSARRSYRAL